MNSGTRIATTSVILSLSIVGWPGMPTALAQEGLEASCLESLGGSSEAAYDGTVVIVGNVLHDQSALDPTGRAALCATGTCTVTTEATTDVGSKGWIAHVGLLFLWDWNLEITESITTTVDCEGQFALLVEYPGGLGPRKGVTVAQLASVKEIQGEAVEWTNEAAQCVYFGSALAGTPGCRTVTTGEFTVKALGSFEAPRELPLCAKFDMTNTHDLALVPDLFSETSTTETCFDILELSDDPQ